jgi:hypothetical protein
LALHSYRRIIQPPGLKARGRCRLPPVGKEVAPFHMVSQLHHASGGTGCLCRQTHWPVSFVTFVPCRFVRDRRNRLCRGLPTDNCSKQAIALNELGLVTNAGGLCLSPYGLGACSCARSPGC